MVKTTINPKRKQEEVMSVEKPAYTSTVQKAPEPAISSNEPNMSVETKQPVQEPPSPNFKSSVKFTPSGRVEYQVGGETFNLSQQEYQGALALEGSQTGGTASPQVKRLVSLRNEERARSQKAFQITKQEEAAQRAGIAEFNAPELSQLSQEEVTGNRLSQGVGNIVESITGFAPIKEALPTVSNLLFTGLDLIPFVSPGSENPNIKKAKSTLTNVDALIASDIQLVKQGLKDPNEVLKSFQEAEWALDRLSRTTKGLGKANLRYWLDEGKETETFLLVEESNLQNLRIQLIAAAQEGRLAQAQAFLGT